MVWNTPSTLTHLQQLAAFSFRTIKYWSGFAGDFLSLSSKCLLQARRYEFDVERAIYLTVLHRLFASGSDRAAERWL